MEDNLEKTSFRLAGMTEMYENVVSEDETIIMDKESLTRDTITDK